MCHWRCSSRQATHPGEHEKTTQHAINPPKNLKLRLTKSMGWQDSIGCEEYAVRSLSIHHLCAPCTMHFVMLFDYFFSCSLLQHQCMMPIYSNYCVMKTQMNKNIFLPYLFSWRLQVLEF